MTTILGKSVDGKNVPIDIDRLVVSRLLLQANSGGGKSWALRRLLEQTHGKVQHLILDVEGEFHTLREKFDYVLAARTGGDVLADVRSAPLLARKLLELGTSAILDLYELRAHDRIRFVRLFLEALIDAPRALWHPALVVVDEAHHFCPQAGSAESGAAVIDLMTRGRKRGFCGVLATQRLSKLHKDAAAEANCKLIGRAAMDVDMKRAGDELGFSSREDLARIRALPAGRFFAFGPGLSEQVVELQVGDVVTTHPRAGRGQAPVPPAREKVQKMLAQLKDLPKEADEEARTLAQAKARIAELERQVRAKPVPPAAPAPKSLEVPVLKDVQLARLEKLCDQLTVRARLGYDKVVAAVQDLAQAIGRRIGSASDTHRVGTNGYHHHGPPARVPSSRVEPSQSARPAGQVGAGLVKCERAIVSVLSTHGACGRSKLGILAGYSSASGGFANALGKLRTAGLISDAGVDPIEVTETGLALGLFNQLPRGPALIEFWRGKVGKCERAIVDALLAAPSGLGREALGEASGYSATSGGFANALGTLRTLQLISPAGHEPIRVCDELLAAAGGSS